MEIMSTNEELMIRSQLEMDVERELAEEIKEGMCHLAFRLQRNAKELSNFGIRRRQQDSISNNVMSEVNINIKMEGETNIEIKKIVKQPRENRLRTPKIEIVRGFMAASPATKKFDWAKSLRSGTSSRIDCSHQSRMLGNKAKTSALQHQQHAKVKIESKTKMLELGWKE